MLAVVVVAGGCSSTDPMLLDGEGYPLSRRQPAMYRLAVAPVEMPPGLKGGLGVTGVRRTQEQLQSDLVQGLAELDTATEVFAVPSGDSFEAYKRHADLLLRPRLEDARFGRIGANGRAVWSSLLWFTTWFGGFWLDDSSYNARLVLNYDLVDPHTGGLIAERNTARSGQVNLDFWDRNEAFSSGFFLSMLIPPCLVTGDKQQTGDTLVRRANEILSAQLKRYLTEDLPAREAELLAGFDFASPINGLEESKGVTVLDCTISSQDVVTEVLVFLNDELYFQTAGPAPGIRKDSEDSGDSGDSRDEPPVAVKAIVRAEALGEGSVEEPGLGGDSAAELLPVTSGDALEVPATANPLSYRLRLDAISLPRSGKNILRVVVNFAGRWASRSVSIFNTRAGVETARIEGGVGAAKEEKA